MSESVQSIRRRLLQLLGLTAVSWGLASKAALAQSDKKPLEQLRIGYQKSAANLVIVKQSGWLEQRLVGTKVHWIEFPAGPQLLEALAVGSLEFGLTGDAPPVFAQAAGSAIVYVAHEPPAPGGEAILVPKDSPIKSVAELKGKKVAYAKGSNANYFAVKALEKAGVKYGEFEPVHLAPADARAAFESGKVDAWSIWDPFYASAEATANARVLQDGTGIVSNHQFYLAGKSAVEKHAKAIEVVLAELNAVNEWVRQDPKAAAEQLAPGTGVPAAILETALKRQSYGVKPLDAKVIEEQQKIGDLFHSLGLIPKTIKVDEIVWRAGS